ncbi:type II toxin-antitoxin system RelE family toxin [Specibacter cremeus]|uniref:type II toxin-antitoxin system RelE family toxin n=1 Tax=Specibacter cremeus TaxID=1629051 RepID=UPI000F79B785|nr:type II toxin-antitoxin system RelE/ParE family toxin [Specibacter cremeus]
MAREYRLRPLHPSHHAGKRLHKPLEDRHSARRGTYRVIYRIDDDQRTVIVVDVAHRRDVDRIPG